VGVSCRDLISSTPVHKVYAGYRDPSQQTQAGNKTYHLEITRNKKIQALCQAFADTWLKDELDEGGPLPPNLEIKKYPGWNMYPGSFRVLAFLTPNTDPVGRLVVYPNATGQWIGEHMGVDTKYQRLGIGTAMWNFAEKTVGGPVTTVNLTADGKKFQKARAKTKQELDELEFLGSPCTRDCSGHRAGYAWSQSKGGQVAQSPFSPSFNTGSQLHVDGK